MPRLSTPRIVPTPRVIFLPGMKAPGGAKTPFMPVRAFGAPHTTCTGSPEPVSTKQTRRRSALGCGFASITRAMVKAESALALSATPSTSSPMRVSVSTISSRGAVVSRWSLSQERVNFISGPYRPLGSQYDVAPQSSSWPQRGEHSLAYNAESVEPDLLTKLPRQRSEYLALLP